MYIKCYRKYINILKEHFHMFLYQVLMNGQ